jgi:serine/threonine protein kinase
MQEVSIWKSLDHPFIIPFHASFQDEQHVHLVVAYASGGDMSGLVRKLRRLEKSLARFYMAEVVCALGYLHEHDIIYRDLKPEVNYTENLHFEYYPKNGITIPQKYRLSILTIYNLEHHDHK